MQCVIIPLFAFFYFAGYFSEYNIFPSCAGAERRLLLSSATLVSAIAAAAGGKPALFTILAFPFMLPVLWVCVRASNDLAINIYASVSAYLLFLLAFSLSMTALSYLFFKFIWAEE